MVFGRMHARHFVLYHSPYYPPAIHGGCLCGKNWGLMPLVHLVLTRICPSLDVWFGSVLSGAWEAVAKGCVLISHSQALLFVPILY